MSKYYSVSDGTEGLAGTTKLSYKKLSPGAALDVYNQGYWKIGPLGGGSDVQQVWVQEFNADSNALVREINKFKSGLTPGNGAANADWYANLYLGSPTGFHYSFPRLIKSGDLIHAPITNSWQANNEIDRFSKIIPKTAGRGGGVVNKAIRAVRGVTGTLGGMVQGADKVVDLAQGFMGENYAKDPMKNYTDSSPQSLTLNFQLYNTPKDNDDSHVDLHIAFTHVFYFQNLKTRIGAFSMLPPKLYNISTKPQFGSMYMPVCYCESYEIRSLGKTHVIDGKAVPEAYDVNIKFTSLSSPCTNSFAAAMQ